MQDTIKNRTIFCKDNLIIMRGINSNSIDLIYLDPPFNTNKVFTAPIGSSAEGASFKDIFQKEDVKEVWLLDIKEDKKKLYDFLIAVKNLGNDYNFCYLCYMAIRLLEMQRILKNTGSLYLHCDPTMSHYLKLLLDIIFKEENFRNEIIWCYSGGGRSKRDFANKHDIILRYSKSNDYIFNADAVRIDYNLDASKYKSEKSWGSHKGTNKSYKPNKLGKIPEDHWKISPINSQSKERTGYPTQKPLVLMYRIIEASSNKGNVVFDPFCGCATTCVASEKLGRQWVGIDLSIEAYKQVKKRLAKEITPELLDPEKEVNFTTEKPKRNDRIGERLDQEFVYIISNPSYPNEYKVGKTNDCKKRLTGFQTGDPNRAYKIEFEFKTPYYREIEDYIHEKYKATHEWVEAKLKEIIKEIENYKP